VEHISIAEKSLPEETVLEKVVSTEAKAKTRVVNGITQYGGILLSIFITFVTVVLVTTDFELIGKNDILHLGLDFFLLMFCSYTVYIACADSGRTAGLRTSVFEEACKKYDEMKSIIINKHYQEHLRTFCKEYVENELRRARENELSLTAIKYEVYKEKYLKLSKEEIKASDELSETEKAAIIRANALKPVVLNEKMLLRRGRGSSRRQPLETAPETKRLVNYSVKLASTLVITVFLSMLIIKVVVTPTWAVIATVLSKLLAIVINAFQGYKFGYQNITVDTVNYMSDQSDFLKQGIQYAETKSPLC
jgi:hypothetical protein